MPQTAQPPPAAPPDGHLYCPDCCYDLRARAGDCCPECGLDLGFIESGTSLIPWCNPARNLLVRFAHTVWLAAFRPRKLLREFYRPVDYYAAQRFRWLCVAIAFASLLAAAGVLNGIDDEVSRETANLVGNWFMAPVALGVLLALIAWSGVPSYFFHPRWLPVELQNRAVALSYYAAAPLALMPIIALAAGFLLLLSDRDPYLPFPIAVVACGALLFLLLIDSANLAARYGRILLRRPGQMAALYVLLPLLLTSVAIVCVVGPPLLALYIALAVHSLA